MIGKKLSPILEELENTLWEFEANRGILPEFTEAGFRSASKIFMWVLMEKMWELQSKEHMAMPDRSAMALKAGEDLRKLVKTYTGFDTFDFYKKVPLQR